MTKVFNSWLECIELSEHVIAMAEYQILNNMLETIPYFSDIENLEEDDLLKLYRKRYKDLASQSSHTRPISNSKQIMKTIRGDPIIRDKYINGLISKEEFKTWIDSTAIKQE